MAQAAAALAEETLPEQEGHQEIAANKEIPLDQAMESGAAENVIDIFHKSAKKKLEAIERLAKVEPTDALFSEIVSKIESANDNARQKIGHAEDTAAKTLGEALGIATETVEAPPAVEEVKAMPVVVVGEEPATELVEAANEDTDSQLEVAAEVVKENYEALIEFCHEHGLKYDPETLKVDEGDLKHLSKAERLYVLVLLAKHAAGKASLEHAEAVRASSPDAEPLANKAVMAEAAAKALETTYMDLPEIQQITGQSSNETGGSIESDDFDGQPPASAPPAGPKGPDQEIRGGGNVASTSREASGVYANTGLESNRITTFRTEGSGEAPKPTWFGNLVSKFIGWPGKQDRH